MIKTDTKGNEIWYNTYRGNKSDIPNCVQQTEDNGYIITGLTDSYGYGLSDVYLIKTDDKGNEEWQKTIGGSDGDMGYSVQQTSDGGYIIAGITQSYGAGMIDIFLIKTNADGGIKWQKTFGGKFNEFCYKVLQNLAGGYIIAGSTSSFGTTSISNAYLLKTDAKGNEEWHKTLGGSDFDDCRCIHQISDGGYILVGGTYSYGLGGKSDVWLIRLNSERK